MKILRSSFFKVYGVVDSMKQSARERIDVPEFSCIVPSLKTHMLYVSYGPDILMGREDANNLIKKYPGCFTMWKPE